MRKREKRPGRQTGRDILRGGCFASGETDRRGGGWGAGGKRGVSISGGRQEENRQRLIKCIEKVGWGGVVGGGGVPVLELRRHRTVSCLWREGPPWLGERQTDRGRRGGGGAQSQREKETQTDRQKGVCVCGV